MGPNMFFRIVEEVEEFYGRPEEKSLQITQPNSAFTF